MMVEVRCQRCGKKFDAKTSRRKFCDPCIPLVNRATYRNCHRKKRGVEPISEEDFENRKCQGGCGKTLTTFQAKYCDVCRPIQKKLVAKNADLMLRFSITLDEYQRRHKQQQGRCAICGRSETEAYSYRADSPRLLAVDHNRTTGAVRELLCGKCNKAIGLMMEDPARLRAAAEYLERHNGQNINAPPSRG